MALADFEVPPAFFADLVVAIPHKLHADRDFFGGLVAYSDDGRFRCPNATGVRYAGRAGVFIAAAILVDWKAIAGCLGDMAVNRRDHQS